MQRTSRVFADLPDEIEEGFLHVDPCQRRRFVEGHHPLLGEIIRLCCRHLPFILQIALVAAKNNRDAVGVLDTQDLLAELVDLVVRLPRRNGIREDKALARAHVLQMKL